MKTEIIVVIFFTLLLMIACSPDTSDNSSVSMNQSLYERIESRKVKAIVEDIWSNHSKNPIVKDRFAASNPIYVKIKSI